HPERAILMAKRLRPTKLRSEGGRISRNSTRIISGDPSAFAAKLRRTQSLHHENGSLWMTVVARLGLLCFFLLWCIPDAAAQSINIGLGKAAGSSVTGKALQLVLLITVISLAPSILMMVTSFTRIIVVLSFLRSALGLQQTPSNAVLI